MPNLFIVATELEALAGVATFAVMLLALVALRRLLPSPRQEEAPWTAVELCACVFLWMFWTSLAAALVLNTPLGEAIYGEDVIAATRETSEDGKLQGIRVSLLFALLAFPFQLLSIPLMMRHVSGTQPRQLGLTTEHWQRNVLLGVLAFLLVMPATQGLFFLMEWLTGLIVPGSARKHELQRLMESELLSAAEMILLVIRPVIVAAVLEELFFRGVLQPWLAKRDWGGPVAMGLGLLAAVPTKTAHWEAIIEGPEWQDRLGPLLPVLFVVLMVPLYFWVRKRETDPAPSALFGVALLFGAIHSSAWPAPVPLFVLGLALGYLRARTQSLVGPIVLHALFNTVGCLMLLLS